jgi:hypothetical protein
MSLFRCESQDIGKSIFSFAHGEEEKSGVSIEISEHTESSKIKSQCSQIGSIVYHCDNCICFKTNIDNTLQERGDRYGKFTGHAEITQSLKGLIKIELDKRNKKLSYDQQEALDMIAHKIGRIINGDSDYADSWIDIAGYAKLVADRLEGDSK